MRVCEQCQVAQFNGKWHCSEKGYFLTENKLYQFKVTKHAKSCRTVPGGTVQKPRFYAGLSPTVPFPSLKPPSAWALKSRFGAAATAAPVLTASARPRLVPGHSSHGPGPRWGPGPTEAAAETAALGRRGFLRAAGKRPALGSVAGPGGFSLCPA